MQRYKHTRNILGRKHTTNFDTCHLTRRKKHRTCFTGRHEGCMCSVCAAMCTHCVCVTVNYVLGLIINPTAIYHCQLITHTSVTTLQYDAAFCSCRMTCKMTNRSTMAGRTEQQTSSWLFRVWQFQVL